MTAAAQIETTFREEHGRVLAALISQLRDFRKSEVKEMPISFQLNLSFAGSGKLRVLVGSKGV